MSEIDGLIQALMDAVEASEFEMHGAVGISNAKNAIRAHVEALEQRAKDAEKKQADIQLAHNVALKTWNELFNTFVLPAGVTVEDVRGVLSDALPHVIAHSAVYARDYGLEITGDKDQVTAQWHPVHREIYNKLTALLAKLTAQPADANGKDEI